MLKCANLDHGLKVGTNGRVSPCCVIKNSELKDDAGSAMNISTHTFDELQKSPTLTKLRNSFANGLPPEECSRCWNEETAGIDSKRLRDNRRIESLDLKVGDLYFLDLQLGNICNLACRSCGIEGTKKWKSDYKEVVNPNITDEELNKLLKTFSDPFNDDSLFWDQMDTVASTVEIIDLYGGEPMLMKKQWEFLKKCVELGTAKNQTVQFNTNGTLYSEDFIDILKEFKQVTISFSLDGLREKFNYIRHLGDWDKVKHNLILWQQAAETYNNLWLNICYTVSTYNVLDFPEMANLAYDLDFDIYTNFVHQPEYFSITNIPEDYKKELAHLYLQNENKWLKSIKRSKRRYILGRTLNFSNGICAFMNSKEFVPSHWHRFKQVTEILDKSRNQSFTETFPILSSILLKEKLV